MNVQMVDGIIVKATMDTEKFMAKLMDLNVPVITVGRHNLSYGAHVLRVNDYHQLPQALFCLNDISAIGALKACKDLSIDDMPTVSELLSLSTIRHPINELAEAASKLMIESIESDGQRLDPVEQVFPTELMVRRTS